MKVAISTRGETLEDELDPHFGRAPKFILFDTQTRVFSVYENVQNAQAAQGAGIQAAQEVIHWGAEAVMTGQVGPKAVRALKLGGVRIFLAPGFSNARAALEALEKGALEEVIA